MYEVTKNIGHFLKDLWVFFRLIAGNETPKQSTNAQLERNAKIKAMIEAYDETDPLEFLQGVAHQMGNAIGLKKTKKRKDQDQDN